ncbi:MAG: ABC transporter substrate-binding protein [Chloroflexota bacterium]
MFSRDVCRRLYGVLAVLAVLVPLGVTSAQDTITLDFYYPTAVDGPIAQILEEYAQQFEAENPGIDVNPIYTGSYVDTRQAIQTEIQGGGTGPDVAVMLATDIFSLAEEGYVVPVQQFIDQMEDPEAFVSDFYESLMVNSVDEEGTIWSIPFQRSTPILYYNKDMFREAGLDPEQPPRNRDELVEYAQKLTLPNGERWGLMVAIAGDFPIWLFQSFVMANGQNLVEESPAKVYLNTPEAVDALKFLIDLGSTYRVQPEGGTSWGDTPTAFTSGQAAMIYHTVGSLTSILQNADFEVGVGYLPSGPAGEDGTGYGTPTGGGNLYIFANSTPEEQEAAWKWVQFLASPEIQADWGAKTGYIAARRSAWETDILQELVAQYPQYAVARDQLEIAGKEFTSYRAIDVQNIINNTVSSILAGERTDIETALAEAQAQIDSLLAEYQ